VFDFNRPNLSAEEWEKYNSELKEHYAGEIDRYFYCFGFSRRRKYVYGGSDKVD